MDNDISFFVVVEMIVEKCEYLQIFIDMIINVDDRTTVVPNVLTFLLTWLQVLHVDI